MAREHHGTRLPDSTATALAAHLLACVLSETPEVHEAAAAQVGEILVVEVVYEVSAGFDTERFEVDQAGDFTACGAHRVRLLSLSAWEMARVGYDADACATLLWEAGR